MQKALICYQHFVLVQSFDVGTCLPNFATPQNLAFKNQNTDSETEAFSPEEFLIYVTSFIFPYIGWNAPIPNEKFRIEVLPSIKLTRNAPIRNKHIFLFLSVSLLSVACVISHEVNLLQKHTLFCKANHITKNTTLSNYAFLYLFAYLPLSKVLNNNFVLKEFNLR